MKNTLSQLARNLQESGKAYRFKKGDAPANKGRKMDASLYAKCSRTMFKAGHLPANTCMMVRRPSGMIKTGINITAENHPWQMDAKAYWNYGRMRMARYLKGTT